MTELVLYLQLIDVFALCQRGSRFVFTDAWVHSGDLFIQTMI